MLPLALVAVLGGVFAQSYANFFEKQPYQDIIVHNQCVQEGERKCAPTYDIIKHVLDTIPKPFSVLDIGAAQGYFSFRIAYDYNALCTMLEGDFDYKTHTSQLFKLCQLNNLPNTLFLRTHITPKLLKKLATQEHFDVVLAFNFIHHCGHYWHEMADAILTLGNTIIVEHPPYDEMAPQSKEWLKRRAIEQYLRQRGAVLLGEVARHTSKTKKTKIFCLTKENQIPCSRFIKKSTFTSCNGVYPVLNTETTYVR